MGILKDKMISDMMVSGYSHKTIKLYTSVISNFSKYHSKSPLDMLPEDIYDYFLYLRKLPLSSASISIYYSALSLFYKFVNKTNLMHMVPVPKRSNRVAAVLNKKEISILLNHCAKLKDKAIFTLIYSSGIRVGELVNIKLEDIDYIRKSIYITKGKGDQQRYAILSDQTAILIKQYIEIYKPTSFLFYSSLGKEIPVGCRWIQASFQKLRKSAGIVKRATVHTLRHSFATHLLEDGYHLFYIQKLLGHADIKSTLVYLHVNPNTLLNIPSPLERISYVKMGIFETHNERGLDFSEFNFESEYKNYISQ
ncbi:tyrosine-type recombinase/integrase [Leptospira sp. 96542]|nr:tyrosine-type recombinase/integrase [Leptospira sp. 96542]